MPLFIDLNEDPFRLFNNQQTRLQVVEDSNQLTDETVNLRAPSTDFYSNRFCEL